MKPLTVSRKKTDIDKVFLEDMSFEFYDDHKYSPVNVNFDDYVKCGESKDREYYVLKTN